MYLRLKVQEGVRNKPKESWERIVAKKMGGSISKSFRSPSPSVAPRLLSSSPVSLVYATRTPLDSELHESCGLSQRDAKQDKRLKPVKQLGLANIGNTCYSNSVLQVLFHCKPFRSRCIAELRNVKPVCSVWRKTSYSFYVILNFHSTLLFLG